MDARIIEKIKKLIAMQEGAEKVGNLEEASAFATKVHQLMHEYNVSMYDITKDEVDKLINETEWYDKNTKKYYYSTRSNRVAHWKISLAMCVAEAFHSKAFYVKDHANSRTGVTFVGMENDIQVAKSIFDFIQNVIQHECEMRYRKEYYKGVAQKGSGWKKGFRLGAVTAIEHRFKESTERTKTDDDGGRGCNLIHIKDAAIKDFLDAKQPNIKTFFSKESNIYTDDALREGYEYGKTINWTNNIHNAASKYLE